ncbi:hypothetical protein [Pedobacter sp. SYP-B3415]|nr:hypothetical protein [Pedobacter sp. SYP-B3415]
MNHRQHPALNKQQPKAIAVAAPAFRIFPKWQQIAEKISRLIALYSSR